MHSKTTKEFRKALQRLPADVRQQARRAYALFKDNPAHPRHTLTQLVHIHRACP